MKISLLKYVKPISLLSLCLLAPQAGATQSVTTKSMLVALSLPAVAGAYSITNGDYEGVKEWALSCLVTAQVTTLLKNSVNRTRPNGENDLSFPSGHTAAAFVGASYLDHRYGLQWGVPMYIIASVIGLERVNVKDHYWSDVVAGAAIGYAAGAIFTVRYPKVWFEPYADTKNGTYGMQVKAYY